MQFNAELRHFDAANDPFRHRLAVGLESESCRADYHDMAVRFVIFSGTTMAQIEHIKWLSGFANELEEFAVKQGRRTLYGLIDTSGKLYSNHNRRICIYAIKKQVMLFHDKRIKGDKDIVLNLETQEPRMSNHARAAFIQTRHFMAWQRPF